MTGVNELSASALRRSCALQELDFETTDDVEELREIVGQPRAMQAIEFGIGIEREGYNIFAHGAPGTGKHSAIRQYLEGRAAELPVPSDLVYAENFADEHRPRLMVLPAGRGSALRTAMEQFVGELETALQAALESEEYQNRRQVLEEQFNELQGKAFAELGEEASGKGLALLRTPMGIVFAPMRGEEVLSPDEFKELPAKEKERLEKEIEHFKEKLQKVFHQIPRWQRETRDKIRDLHLQVSRFAVRPLIEELRESFGDLEAVVEYLDAVEKDVVENAHRLAARSEGQAQVAALGAGVQGTDPPLLRRYRVNCLVDHSSTSGAPVVYEDNPTYQNLVGRVEHVPQLGVAMTDFNLIKPGALHRANGGYLIVDALKLLGQPYAWEGLKRALRSRQIRIESIGEALSLISTYSLQAEPAPLAVKVVLLGDTRTYHLLAALDPDFGELFKVGADFSNSLDWTGTSEESYVRVIAKLVKEEKLRPFDRSAVARVIERGARWVGDSAKVSLQFSRILDLLREADYWASQNGHDVVTAADVRRAIDAHTFRSDLPRERVHEGILRRTILVDTEGARVGQINGLSVLQLGDFAFGRPSRITARVRLGKGEVVNIEREVELSGPIHSKGVLILAGFLGAHFVPDRPLSLSASLVFEQSYGGVDGDSASSAELYALLSALAGVPLRQSLAVTGSVNQRGEIQAIGGVNEKIEGFFDICSARGLTGDQGVVIPRSNVEHLMLRDDVIDAVEKGTFHIYPVESVEQGLELLTGLQAGERDASGTFPPESLNGRVEQRLVELAEAARSFARPAGEKGGDAGAAGGAT